ncbi:MULTISPECIES: ATP-binding protein [unclassified Clostridium]|uniref:ATP-binding protein n=1 Tax=unclassified Clostridium TaxID=2614128 RepID=UPI0025C32D9C|nr:MULTISPECIES: ATP-binding protein [unclassified Clostridium]
MNDEILIIGEVIEVRGQKVRIKIYSNKNSSMLLYNGNMIRNISVGSFIKISKGYIRIIGRIEGEYIRELPSNKNDYARKEEGFERIVEVSIVGYLDRKNNFKHGISDMPLISNSAYILSENEIQKIFVFFQDSSKAIKVGNILGYEKYCLQLDINKIFASHIGIFGNTGSGKSNTLARLYTELFDRYSGNSSFFSKSRFLILDFNGEYTNKRVITSNKMIYNLSTNKESNNKYPIEKEYIFDEEFWSIIAEATDKTQKPFIRRVIKKCKEISSTDNITNLKNEISLSILDLVKKLYEIGDKYSQYKGYFVDLICSGFNINDKDVESAFNKIGYHKKQEKLYVPKESTFFNDHNEFLEYKPIKNILNKITANNFKMINSLNYFDIFSYMIKYQYLFEIIYGYSVDEHIAPLVKRVQSRFNDIQKVFTIAETSTQQSNIEVISLVDVNITMRKILPMIVCKQNYDKQKKSEKGANTLHIIIDEAHNILSQVSERESNVWKDYRLEVFEEIIKEGRKFGVFLTITSQRPSDISPTLISQLHNYFLHRLVNNEDIKAISKTIAFLDHSSYETIPILPQGACIITGTALNFPVVVQIDLLDKDKQPDSQTIDLAKLWR